jgi:hypothetical protein
MGAAPGPRRAAASWRKETPMKEISAVLAAAIIMTLGTAHAAERKPAPQGATVYIVWPRDGGVIRTGKFWIRMGLSGAGIAPAGVDKPNTGHHHLLIDTDLPPLDQEIPNDKNHLHFGAGQTEARIELPPGKHTLQLLFADANHVPFDPPIMSKKITIIVPEQTAKP